MKIPQFFNIRKAVNSGDALKLDLPMFSFIGLSLGFLCVGVIYATLGALINADEGDICSITTVIGGLSSVLVSIIASGIAGLYWWLVPRRHNMSYPQLFWFGFIFAALSFVSGVMIGGELAINVHYYLK